MVPTSFPEFIALHFQAKNEREAEILVRLNQFLAENGEGALRHEIAGGLGHVVAQARIENRDGTKILLVHSAKEGRWKYPGAHIESDPHQTAINEASRALGRSIAPLNKAICALSERLIPEYWNTPAHIHFEITFRFVTDETKELPRGARWYSIEEAEGLLQASPEVE